MLCSQLLNSACVLYVTGLTETTCVCHLVWWQVPPVPACLTQDWAKRQQEASDRSNRSIESTLENARSLAETEHLSTKQGVAAVLCIRTLCL